MKIVRIDELAPGGAEIELHPQLTVLRGVSPEMRRRVTELFRALAGGTEPGCGGLIEVSGVHLGLDRGTLDGLRLDPLIDPVLVWPTSTSTSTPTPPSTTPPPPSTTPPPSTPTQVWTEAPASDPTAPTGPPTWVPPVPVGGAQVVPDPRDLVAQYLARDREQLRSVGAQRTDLGRRMDEVRTGLDSFANAALEVCVGQIDALESRRSLLRSQWERDRAVRLEQRRDLAADLARANDELDALISLDLGPVRVARDSLAVTLEASVEPDPVANELATQIDDALRVVRELSGRASSVEVRRDEAQQRLAEATADAITAEHTMRTRVFDPADVSRLDQVRDEIFAFDDRHSRLGASRNKRKVRELRDEEAVLLERLGFDTYSSYVMGIPSVRAELERSSRLDAATTRIEHIERELQSLAVEAPADDELSGAEHALSLLVSRAAELLGEPLLLHRPAEPPAAPSDVSQPDASLPDVSQPDASLPDGTQSERSPDDREPSDAAQTGTAGETRGPGRAAEARSAAWAELVHQVVTKLRSRRVVASVDFEPEAYAAAEHLRRSVQQVGSGRFSDPSGAAPTIGGTQIDAEAWHGSPRDVLDGVDGWLALLAESSSWIDDVRGHVASLHVQLADLDREDLHQGDVSEWAVVEAELDAALDRMAAAEERVRAHDQSIAELAALRDTELGLRATERELLGAIAAREQELRDWPEPGSVVPPTTRLPPAYQPAEHSAVGDERPGGPLIGDVADPDSVDPTSAGVASFAGPTVPKDLEWVFIERLAQQRVVSFVGSVPMLLDGVPADLDARAGVFDRAARMGEVVQIVVLSDDDWVLDWVAHSAPAAAVIQF